MDSLFFSILFPKQSGKKAVCISYIELVTRSNLEMSWSVQEDMHRPHANSRILIKNLRLSAFGDLGAISYGYHKTPFLLIIC